MIKIANIVCDEKFIDGIIEAHDMVSNGVLHDYIIVTSRKLKSYRFIRTSNRIIQIYPKDFLSYIDQKQYNAIFLHSLCCLPLSLIPRINARVKVFWFAWGYDIYGYPPSNPFIDVPLLHPLTEKSIQHHNLNILKLKEKIVSALTNRKLKIEAYNAIHRIDYFSGVLEFEYDLLKPLPKFRAKPVRYFYTNRTELDVDYDSIPLCNGDNIVVGNSAAYTNNHLDALAYLQNIEIGNRKIIVPLSYCGTKNYIRTITKAYTDAFGDKFLPLCRFMPYNEYNDIIYSCNIAIYFHERQQAMGNINMALRKGCKVFLSETSPVFKFYKEIGLKIFSIQNELTQNEIDTPLHIEHIKRNRDILKRRYCKESYLKMLNDIISV